MHVPYVSTLPGYADIDPLGAHPLLLRIQPPARHPCPTSAPLRASRLLPVPRFAHQLRTPSPAPRSHLHPACGPTSNSPRSDLPNPPRSQLRTPDQAKLADEVRQRSDTLIHPGNTLRTFRLTTIHSRHRTTTNHPDSHTQPNPQHTEQHAPHAPTSPTSTRPTRATNNPDSHTQPNHPRTEQHVPYAPGPTRSAALPFLGRKPAREIAPRFGE